MKIRTLELTEKDLDGTGLKPFKSQKMGDTIALVGKNGSGKSRYLVAIEKKLMKPDFTEVIYGYFDNLSPEASKLADSLKSIAELSKIKDELEFVNVGLNRNHNSKELFQQKNVLQRKYTQHLGNVANSHKTLEQIPRINGLLSKHFSSRIKVIKPNDLKILKSSIEKNRPDVLNFQNVVDSIEKNVDVNELSMINETAIGFLQSLPLKLTQDELEAKGDLDKFQRGIAYKRYLILSELVESLLGKKLTYYGVSGGFEISGYSMTVKYNGGWICDGIEFNYNNFSDGEKVLFTYAILFFLLSENPKVKFSESIVLIDEPEIHLHPKAQVDLIQKLQSLLKENGQLIIATHSLSIIANLDYESIHLVQNNELISPSSSIPYTSVDQLMGFDEHYLRMVEFLVSTPSWAMTKFMSQCFEDPEVFDYAVKTDPQLQLVQEILTKGKALNVLDFGSGSGRLLTQIRDNEEVWSRIENYDCFDIKPKYKSTLISSGAKNFFVELKEIPTSKYDLVIMVNVLHEIPISEWEESLNAIRNSLKEDGYLALIEDTMLPVGELPNDHGFLLLDKEEMKVLLGDDASILTPQSSMYKNRIICAFVAKTNMRNVKPQLLIQTLELLKENSLKSVVNFRKEKSKEASLGRLYALKANLYLNCTLAIQKLKGEISGLQD